MSAGSVGKAFAKPMGSPSTSAPFTVSVTGHLPGLGSPTCEAQLLQGHGRPVPATCVGVVSVHRLAGCLVVGFSSKKSKTI